MAQIRSESSFSSALDVEDSEDTEDGAGAGESAESWVGEPTPESSPFDAGDSLPASARAVSLLIGIRGARAARTSTAVSLPSQSGSTGESLYGRDALGPSIAIAEESLRSVCATRQWCTCRRHCRGNFTQ